MHTQKWPAVPAQARWAVLLLGCLLTWRAAAISAPEVKLLRVPHAGLQPQALVDSSGTLHLVYLAGDPKACDVMYVRRLAGQTNFSDPIRVNSKPGSAIAIGTVRGAQIALGRNGRLHVAWNGSEAAGASPGGGAPMLYTRMNDSGDGFEPQRNLMTSTIHLDGGGSVAADSEGRVYVVWHGHKKTGPQEEIDRAVFVATSTDDGRSFSAERPVNPPDTGVCGCCGLKAFADARGALAILYRSANPLGNRDSVLLLSTNHGASFVPKVLGQWHVSTCPMSTHDLVPDGDGLSALWERAGQIFFAGLPKERLDDLAPVAAAGSSGNRKHPTFARLPGMRAPQLIAWTEGTGWEKGGALAWECLGADGALLTSGRVSGVPVWSFAAAVAEANGSFTLLY